MRYPVVLHSDDSEHFGVTVPDIPGCFSAGDSVGDAIREAEEAINVHLEALAEAGEHIPEAQDINMHFGNPDYAGGIWAFAEVDISPFLGKAERLNITLPHNVLARIDAEVAAHPGRYPSRSNFMMQAALKLLQEDRPLGQRRYRHKSAKVKVETIVIGPSSGKKQSKWTIGPQVQKRKA